MNGGLLTLRPGDPRAARAIAALVHGEGQFLLPLLAGVQSGALSLVWANDRQTSPSALRRALDDAGSPTALILDGDDYFPGAPDDWRCAGAALGWAKGVLVHGAAGERGDYEAAALAAVLTGRLLVVHCSGAEAAAWAERAGAASLCPLVIAPRPGVVHPQPPQAAGPLQ